MELRRAENSKGYKKNVNKRGCEENSRRTRTLEAETKRKPKRTVDSMRIKEQPYSK
jgi:hypothetical protein